MATILVVDDRQSNRQFLTTLLVLAASLAVSVLLFWLMSSLAVAQSRGVELAQSNRTAVRLSKLGLP